MSQKRYNVYFVRFTVKGYTYREPDLVSAGGHVDRTGSLYLTTSTANKAKQAAEALMKLRFSSYKTRVERPILVMEDV